jgi:DNA-binding transcriptional ArsR family regulator
MPNALSGSLLTRYASRARIMKALAHPARLFIVDELAAGPRCVRDLTAMIGTDVSTVSKHLLVLKSVGIVADERRGARVFYTLQTPCVRSWPSCVEGVLAANSRRARRAAG